MRKSLSGKRFQSFMLESARPYCRLAFICIHPYLSLA
jgi:hypothetical protein